MSSEEKKSSLETKHSLLERLQDQSDEKSWREFINYYEQFIYNIIRKFNLSESDAEEMCQDIILKLWKILPEFKYDKTRGKFRSWLATIIRGETINFIRSNQRHKKLIDENQEYIVDQVLSNSSSTQLDHIIEEEWAKHVANNAWDSIKHRFRDKAQKVFLLFIEGNTVAEISEECDIAENTVYVYKKRIRDALEEEIEKQNIKFS